MTECALTEAAEALRELGWDVHPSTEDPYAETPGLTARRGNMSIILAPHPMHEYEAYPDWEARLRDLEREPRDVDRGHGASAITAMRDAGVQV